MESTADISSKIHTEVNYCRSKVDFSSDRSNIPKALWHNTYYPENFILDKPDEKIPTLVSQMEPKWINEEMEDESWVQAMKEELNQFEWNPVWTLIERPKDYYVSGIKWAFRKELDENG